MIALACDHHGIALKHELMKLLDEMDLEWKDFGTFDVNGLDDYPVYGYKAAKAVASGECDRGILLCGTGMGISIAAGKVKGIRVCTCSDVYSAEMSKRHNNSNILTMGALVVGTERAKMIARHWLTAEFEGGRHQRWIDMITRIENGEDPELPGFRWTDGRDPAFRQFYTETEKYYNLITGGAANRAGFIPFNASDSIPVVLIAEDHGKPVGCAGLKPYSGQDIEIKRVWIEPEYRGKHIASQLMDRIEEKAREMKYKRTVLQTRLIMHDAVRLYEKRGYTLIENYPPYDKLDGAICMALNL